MKKLKKITSIMSAIMMIALLVFIISMKFYPEETSQAVGYRFYTVLTNSMEPEIPTYSLVFSKMIEEDEPLKANDIVTFKANRFGEDILLTHYFRKTQYGDDGNLYYRTQGATADDFDNYETKRSDIVGKYVFHIPFVGKIILFLQSKFGFILYGELLVIYLIYKTILVKMEENEETKKQKDAYQEIDSIADNQEDKQEINELPVNVEVQEESATDNLIKEEIGYVVDKNLSGVYGQVLNDVIVMDRDFLWKNNEEKLKTGLHAYQAYYVPKHYNIDGALPEINVLVDTRKAVPDYQIPQLIRVNAGSKLSSLTLPKGFVWKDEQIIVQKGLHRCEALYVPEDINNYEYVEVQIEVEGLIKFK